MNSDIFPSPVMVLRIMYISYKPPFTKSNCHNFLIEFLQRHVYLGFPALKSILLSMWKEYCGK